MKAVSLFFFLISINFFLTLEVLGQVEPHQPASNDKRYTDTKSKPVFPCDLSKYEKLPKIFLVGMKDEEGAACLKYKEEKMKQGVGGGKCYVGLEGAYCEVPSSIDCHLKECGLKQTDQSRLFGFDDPVAHGLSLLMLYYAKLMAALDGASADQTAAIKLDFTLNIKYNPVIEDAWKNIDRPFKIEDEERIAKVLDEILKSDEDPEERIKLLTASHPWHSSQRYFQNILATWMRSYVKMVEDKHKDSPDVPKDLSQKIESFISGKDVINALMAIILEWRNPIMAKNIAKMYCDVVEKGEDLHIITGELHTTGLKTLLQEMSGNKVQVEIKDAEKELQQMIASGQCTPPAAPPKDSKIQIEKLSTGKPIFIVMDEAGKRYLLYLNDNPIHDWWKAGAIEIFRTKPGPAIEQEKEKAYFLYKLREEAKTNAEIRTWLKELKLLDTSPTRTGFNQPNPSMDLFKLLAEPQ